MKADLVCALRDYIENEVRRKKRNVSNLLSGILCAIQILYLGNKDGADENDTEEKDFIDALYTALSFMMVSNPSTAFHDETSLAIAGSGVEDHDFMVLLKTLDILFLRKRQFSTPLVASFIKKIALLALQVPAHVCVSLLFLLKLISNKYALAKDMIDPPDYDFDLFKFEVNDP
jgi:hypothetical protein